MNTQRIFMMATAFSAMAVAAIIGQSLFQVPVAATHDVGPFSTLRQRVAELEQRQGQDDQEFLLVDATLTDMKDQLHQVAAQNMLFQADLRDLRKQLNDLKIPVSPVFDPGTVTEAPSRIKAGMTKRHLLKRASGRY